jgi:hypothetical protein
VKREQDSAAEDAGTGRDAAWSQEQPVADNSPTMDMSAEHRDAGSHHGRPV